MKCDYHLHSYYSDDSKTPMNDQINRAIELGLNEMCFTEHVDYGIKRDWSEGGITYRNGEPLANADYTAYFRELEQRRQEYAGKITLKAGLEFGIQTHTIRRYESLYEQYRDKIDFILLSIHQVNDLEFWTQDFQAGKSQAEYNHEYYNELLRVVQNYHDYSVLAHLDLIVRYDKQGIYPFENVRDTVEEILRTVVADGKGIELNTSSWRYGLKDTQPSRAIWEMYRDLGGEILTLGSDAHVPVYLADHMDDGRNILWELGFRHFCTFEKMKPVYHEL